MCLLVAHSTAGALSRLLSPALACTNDQNEAAGNAAYCLNVKSRVLFSPAPTVIFWTDVPSFSCHAVMV
jgi:hypothetical protein